MVTFKDSIFDILMCRYSDVSMCRSSDDLVFRNSARLKFRISDVSMFRYSGDLMFRSADILTFRYADVTMFNRADTPMFQYFLALLLLRGFPNNERSGSERHCGKRQVLVSIGRNCLDYLALSLLSIIAPTTRMPEKNNNRPLAPPGARPPLPPPPPPAASLPACKLYASVILHPPTRLMADG